MKKGREVFKIICFILVFTLLSPAVNIFAEGESGKKVNIVYTDGAGGKYFMDVGFNGKLGEPTPEFSYFDLSGVEITKTERTGYGFVGWSPEERGNIVGDAEYTASGSQWRILL